MKKGKKSIAGSRIEQAVIRVDEKNRNGTRASYNILTTLLSAFE